MGRNLESSGRELEGEQLNRVGLSRLAEKEDADRFARPKISTQCACGEVPERPKGQ